MEATGTTISAVVHYACDVGSTRAGNFGWARVVSNGGSIDARGGASIDTLLDNINTDLRSKKFALTIGMECPMFLPVPGKSDDLGAGRAGERDRSCFAPAGGYVATLGLHQFAFLLRSIKREGVLALLDWKTWKPNPAVILFWEAFVAGKAHCDADDRRGHVKDAATAAAAIEDVLAEVQAKGNAVCVPAGTRPLSLAGCALLWARWSEDVRLLAEEVLVVKPELPYSGPITEVE